MTVSCLLRHCFSFNSYKSHLWKVPVTLVFAHIFFYYDSIKEDIVTVVIQDKHQSRTVKMPCYSGCPCRCSSLTSVFCSYSAGDAPTLSGQNSPRPHRSSRPLSSVFQNIHPPNIWRHRKGGMSFTQVRLQHEHPSSVLCFVSNTSCSCSFVVQVTVSEEGSISGALQRTKKSKRSWKRLWFLLKDKVLYTYRAQEVRGNVHAPLT